MALGEEPADDELQSALHFITGQEREMAAQPADDKSPPSQIRALASLCQALLSSNRFLYID